MSDTTAEKVRRFGEAADRVDKHRAELARAWEEGWRAAQESPLTAPYPEDNPYRLLTLCTCGHTHTSVGCWAIVSRTPTGGIHRRCACDSLEPA